MRRTRTAWSLVVLGALLAAAGTTGGVTARSALVGVGVLAWAAAFALVLSRRRGPALAAFGVGCAALLVPTPALVLGAALALAGLGLLVLPARATPEA